MFSKQADSSTVERVEEPRGFQLLRSFLELSENTPPGWKRAEARGTNQAVVINTRDDEQHANAYA